MPHRGRLDAVRTAPQVTLPLALDQADPRPLPGQLADALRALVTAGALAPGDPVPSTRALATHLGTSRGTVVAAYEQLLAEGYLGDDELTARTFTVADGLRWYRTGDLGEFDNGVLRVHGRADDERPHQDAQWS